MAAPDPFGNWDLVIGHCPESSPAEQLLQLTSKTVCLSQP
jgi:hypothetical protein